MRADPRHWSRYYHGEGRELELQLEYSLSDRIRYYWHVPAVVEALARLEVTFNAGSPPLALLRQYLPAACEAVRHGETQLSLQSLVIHHIREVLSQYSRACDQRADKTRGVSR
jgi:D-tagatose-1,6-bisphosphate aldolase subunit GatZ/KbaZ